MRLAGLSRLKFTITSGGRLRAPCRVGVVVALALAAFVAIPVADSLASIVVPTSSLVLADHGGALVIDQVNEVDASSTAGSAHSPDDFPELPESPVERVDILLLQFGTLPGGMTSPAGPPSTGLGGPSAIAVATVSISPSLHSQRIADEIRISLLDPPRGSLFRPPRAA